MNKSHKLFIIRLCLKERIAKKEADKAATFEFKIQQHLKAVYGARISHDQNFQKKVILGGEVIWTIPLSADNPHGLMTVESYRKHLLSLPMSEIKRRINKNYEESRDIRTWLPEGRTGFGSWPRW